MTWRAMKTHMDKERFTQVFNTLFHSLAIIDGLGLGLWGYGLSVTILLKPQEGLEVLFPMFHGVGKGGMFFQDVTLEFRGNHRDLIPSSVIDYEKYVIELTSNSFFEPVMVVQSLTTGCQTLVLLSSLALTCSQK
jgi:hypothetical protein